MGADSRAFCAVARVLLMPVGKGGGRPVTAGAVERELVGARCGSPKRCTWRPGSNVALHAMSEAAEQHGRTTMTTKCSGLGRLHTITCRAGDPGPEML